MDIWLWAGFIAIVLGLLVLDLAVFHKKAHEVSTKEAVFWSVVWISIGVSFTGLIYLAYENHWFNLGNTALHPADGKTAAIEYITGFLIEKSLSVDNIFVIALIFSYFGIPAKYQHETLFYGILGALIFRGLMIGIGAALIQEFEWVMYLFGIILIYSAIKLFGADDDNVEPENNPLLKLFKRFYPVSDKLDGDKFFTVINGKRAMTPLFVVLLVIETTDVMFAFDSIPAIFAITRDPFIVFASNVFAIMGLRALYFILASVIDKFKYLKPALIVILLFVGFKMILTQMGHDLDWHGVLEFLEEHSWISLVVVFTILTVGVVASMVANKEAEKKAAAATAEESPVADIE